jgi:signal transduction histidine kinase
MRAESHYVEALSRPRQKRPVPTGSPPADARVSQPTERVLATATESLARTVHSLQATLAEVGLDGRSLRDRMLLELARAEAARAAWMSEAVTVLQREPMPGLDQVNLGAIISRVADALGPEQRLTGQTLAVGRADRPVTVFGDERLLTVAVGSMVQGMAACVGSAGLSRIALRLVPLREGATRGVEVSQTGVRMPATVLARLFEMDWPEHPGGGAGAILLAAAQRIATLQGGTLDARPLDGGGCRLVLSLPAAE